jgi:hypothetical protein
MEEKLRRQREQPDREPFVDATACRTYAVGAAKRLDQRADDEAKPTAHR